MDILNALIFAYSLSVGAGHSDYTLWQSNEMQFDKMTLITSEFNCELSAYGVYLGGSVSTPAVCKEHKYLKPGGYTPIQNSYGFSAGYRYKSIEIGYLHVCQHPTMANLYNIQLRDLSKRFEGSYFKVFAKISKSFSPFK